MNLQVVLETSLIGTAPSSPKIADGVLLETTAPISNTAGPGTKLESVSKRCFAVSSWFEKEQQQGVVPGAEAYL
jgi:hypothetical protein